MIWWEWFLEMQMGGLLPPSSITTPSSGNTEMGGLAALLASGYLGSSISDGSGNGGRK